MQSHGFQVTPYTGLRSCELGALLLLGLQAARVEMWTAGDLHLTFFLCLRSLGSEPILAKCFASLSVLLSQVSMPQRGFVTSLLNSSVLP